jgi:hypothetical protein
VNDDHQHPRQRFQEAVRAILARNPIMEHPDVVGRAWDALSEPEKRAYLIACGMEDVHRVVEGTASVFAEPEGRYQGPREPHSSLAVIRPTNGHAPASRIGGWRARLADETPPKRLALMTREDLLTEVDRCKRDGLGRLKQAAVYAALADGLAPGERVKDRWSPGDVAAMAGRVDDWSAWLRVEELAALPAGEDDHGREHR